MTPYIMMFYGALAVMAVYNGLLYLSLREWSYLAYAGFIGISLVNFGLLISRLGIHTTKHTPIPLSQATPQQSVRPQRTLLTTPSPPKQTDEVDNDFERY